MRNVALFFAATLMLFSSAVHADTFRDSASVTVYEAHGKTRVLVADRNGTVFAGAHVTFGLFKSHDPSITIDLLPRYEARFRFLSPDETFQETNTTYWLRIDLGAHFPSGRFICSYGDADFTEHTFAPSQKMEKFTLFGVKRMQFTYRAATDPRIYYFKLLPHPSPKALKFVYIATPETFFARASRKPITLLLQGILLGLILMAAIYNGALFCYNRDRSFLYYMILQLFMLALLFSLSGNALLYPGAVFPRSSIFWSIVSLFVAFFATLFSIHFLNTKNTLPKFHIYFKVSTGFILMDMLAAMIHQSYIYTFSFYPFFMLPFLLAGFVRMRQGYKPAQFYFAGLVALTLSVYLTLFDPGSVTRAIPPLYIGAALEAILLSLAISYKVRMIEHEREKQKELLVHQSRLASMGELLGNIAHQWRQPLSHLSYMMMNLQEAQRHRELDDAYLDRKISEVNTQLAFMSQTIDDFRDFYAPDKPREDFSLTQATWETLALMKNALMRHRIDVEVISRYDAIIHNDKNGYKQVLLNLLTNAGDALMDRRIAEPHITITIEKAVVSVADNAGGIDPEILPRIFDPYFSTREQGSGIGLYMSRVIIETNMGGKLEADRGRDGAVFRIDLSASHVREK